MNTINKLNIEELLFKSQKLSKALKSKKVYKTLDVFSASLLLLVNDHLVEIRNKLAYLEFRLQEKRVLSEQKASSIEDLWKEIEREKEIFVCELCERKFKIHSTEDLRLLIEGHSCIKFCSKKEAKNIKYGPIEEGTKCQKA